MACCSLVWTPWVWRELAAADGGGGNSWAPLNDGGGGKFMAADEATKECPGAIEIAGIPVDGMLPDPYQVPAVGS